VLAVLVAVAVTTGVAAGVVLVPPDAHAVHLPWRVEGRLVVHSLPVELCGGHFTSPARGNTGPTDVRAEVPANLASHVELFRDARGSIEVLAPKGWRCTSLAALGGASTIEVYPPSTPAPTWGAVHSVARGIVAEQTGGCQGCSLELACPLFHSAWLRFESTYRLSCRRDPIGESVRRSASPTAMLFSDPPGVVGAGRPSGGGLPAFGAIVFLEHGRTSRSWVETCTLPVSDHNLCVLSVRAFVQRHVPAPPSARPR
jgi:hypothetical protein